MFAMRMHAGFCQHRGQRVLIGACVHMKGLVHAAWLTQEIELMKQQIWCRGSDVSRTLQNARPCPQVPQRSEYYGTTSSDSCGMPDTRVRSESSPVSCMHKPFNLSVRPFLRQEASADIQQGPHSACRWCRYSAFAQIRELCASGSVSAVQSRAAATSFCEPFASARLHAATSDPILSPLTAAQFLWDPLAMARIAEKEYGDVFTVEVFGQRLTFMIGPEAQEHVFSCPTPRHASHHAPSSSTLRRPPFRLYSPPQKRDGGQRREGGPLPCCRDERV